MLAATTLVDSLLLDLAMLVAKVDHLAIPVVLGIELDRSTILVHTLVRVLRVFHLRQDLFSLFSWEDRVVLVQEF